MLYSSVFSVELYKLVVSLSLNGLKDLFLLNLDWKELKEKPTANENFSSSSSLSLE